MAELSQAELDYIGMVFAQAQSLYPQYAWALQQPELASVLVKAAQEQWDEGRTASAIQGTEWWKSRSEAQRQWAQISGTDPGEANRLREQKIQEILNWGSQNGIPITRDEAAYVAGGALDNGMPPQEWQALLAAEFIGRRGQSAAPVADQLNAMASEYAVPMSGETLRQWEQNILSGQADQNTFRAYLAEQAKSLFPSLSNAIDRGITVKQYVASYQEIAVQELGINPEEVDWRDPKWNTAIHRQTQNGPVAMSLSEWTRELRTNSVYGYDQTQRAQEQAAQLGQALLERFGRAA